MAAGRCYVWFIVSTQKGEVNSFQTVVTSVFAVIVNVEEANVLGIIFTNQAQYGSVTLKQPFLLNGPLLKYCKYS